jgi:hypothetical protein
VRYPALLPLALSLFLMRALKRFFLIITECGCSFLKFSKINQNHLQCGDIFLKAA